MIKIFREVLPSRLKEARIKNGLTQEEVAKELKVTHATIGNYENGKREPDIEMLGKLAVFYEISVDYLLGLGKPNQNEENIKKHQESQARKEILKELG